MWKTNSYASMVAAAVLKLADPFHNLGLRKQKILREVIHSEFTLEIYTSA
jgi:hypothetical protein